MIEKIYIIKNYIYYRLKKYKRRKKLEKYQQKKIKKQLKFITKNSKFYSTYKGKELKEFPIMNKKIMMDNFNSLNTVNIDKDEALEFAINCERERNFSPKLNNITIGLSSGTSNTRGVFLISDKEKSQWAGYIIAKILENNIFKRTKVAFFMRANSNLYEAVKSKKIVFEFFDILKPMSENIEKLKEFNADILVGQPSVLLEICKNVKDDEIVNLPKKVYSIAEVLEDKDAEYIKKILKIDVIHQVYQCTEGCLAITCKYGKIHLNEDIVFIEKEYIDNNRFVPIITDFERKSQPIIRYRLNDILIEDKKQCECGSCFTVLKKIEGREDDVFIFNGISENTVQVYPDFIRRCILFADNIDEYRVVQKGNEKIIIYLDSNEDVQNKIIKEFEKLAIEMKFELPRIEFKEYSYNKSKKLKRIERIDEIKELKYN